MNELRTILIFWYIVWGIGCSLNPVVSKVIVDEPDKLVRLDVINRIGNSEFSHPISITPQKIEKLLSAVTVRPRSVFAAAFSKEKTEKAAFTEVDRRFLAQHFSKAFRQATSLEQVVFYFNQPRNQHLREITSGGAYIRGKAFHIIFSNYRYAISGKMQGDKALKAPLLVLGEFQYDLDSRSGHKEEEGSSFLGQSLRNIPQHLILSLDMSGSQKSSGSQQPSQVDSLLPADNRTVVEKLQLLEQLKAEHLITDEEYQKKRKELLDNF